MFKDDDDIVVCPECVGAHISQSVCDQKEGFTVSLKTNMELTKLGKQKNMVHQEAGDKNVLVVVPDHSSDFLFLF